jgi:branched-chain amino acid aminotransferase
LITPPLSSSALDGITRKSILEFTKNVKIKTKIQEISNNELKKADEVFLTGTAAEITPVIKIESKKIGDGKVGNVTKQIMDTYTQIVMNNNKKFSKWLTNVYKK